MYISRKGLELLKEFEHLELKAYRDGGGVWTIGYGHTRGVYPGMVIDEPTADKMLLDDVWQFEEGVNAVVKVPINQNQFDALVCFSFNVGLDEDHDGRAEGLGDSTLLKKLNAGDYVGAAAEFPKWNKDNGVVVRGLTNRRLREQSLFLST